MTRFPARYALAATLDTLDRRLADQRAVSRAAIKEVAGFTLRKGILDAIIDRREGSSPASGRSEAP